MKGKKTFRRITVAAVTAALAIGSFHFSGMVTAAEEKPKPYYKPSDGQYSYADGDILGAATHVHLFANEITSSVHTHGNVFCKIANLSEYGTRTEHNDLGNPLPYYDEVSYIQDSIQGINGASRINTLVVGPGIAVGSLDGRYTVNGTKLDNTDHVYNSGNAIDFQAEFAKLTATSKAWAGQGNTAGITSDIADTNNFNDRKIQITDTTLARDSNAFFNVTYDQWKSNNGNKITIKGLDSNAANQGILIINIDAQGNSEINLTLNNGVGAVTENGQTIENREYNTSEYGACRIIYNIVSNGEPFEGKVTFGDTVMGTILAPKADITVGAVNGTVIADKINHTGGESHRMDVWALDTTNNAPVENNITNNATIVVRTVYYDSSSGNATEGKLPATKYGLYTTSGSGAMVLAQADSFPEGDGQYGRTTFERKFSNLSNGENIFYVREISAAENYDVNGMAAKCRVFKNGTSITVEYFDEKTQQYQSEPPIFEHRINVNADVPGGNEGGSGNSGGTDTPGSADNPGGSGGTNTPDGGDDNGSFDDDDDDDSDVNGGSDTADSSNTSGGSGSDGSAGSNGGSGSGGTSGNSQAAGGASQTQGASGSNGNSNTLAAANKTAAGKTAGATSGTAGITQAQALAAARATAGDSRTAAANKTAGNDKVTTASMVSAQTGESTVPFVIFGGSLSAIFMAGVVYVIMQRKKEEAQTV